jgi:hypothetical protein
VRQDDARVSAGPQADQESGRLSSLGRPIQADDDGPDVTSTADDQDWAEALRTTLRETLPINSRVTGPWPRQPSTMIFALHRRASRTIPSAGRASTTAASAFGHVRRRLRRAPAATRSKCRPSASITGRALPRLQGERRATTAWTRVPGGQGNVRVVAIAARAWLDPSVATKTLKSLGSGIAILIQGLVTEREKLLTGIGARILP